MPSRNPASTAKRLVDEYKIYDEYVDVVSAFEFLMTVPADMAATVRHFERFPKITDATGADSTPDFTVLFTDGTALVGEISSLSLEQGSVDSACSQLLRYDGLTLIPDERGQLVPVTDVSVMLIVPLRVGPDALDRIIKGAMADPENDYKPTKPPCVVQYARDPERYMFQRIADPANGAIDGHGRTPNVGDYVRQLNVQAHNITKVKADRAFMNDPIKALYLAVHLYVHTWPTAFPAQRDPIEVRPVETARTLRQQFGVGSKADVERALALIAAAGLAHDNRDGTWRVDPRPPRMRGEHDLVRILAKKASEGRKSTLPPPTSRTAEPPQDTLF